MRIIVGILLTLGISLGMYFVYMREITPKGAGASPIQNISTTGVKLDLTAIGEAERSYLALNGSYGTRDQLISSGILTMTRTGRDGYTYALDLSASGFTASAKWSPQTAAQTKLTYPTIVMDQTMNVHEIP